MKAAFRLTVTVAILTGCATIDANECQKAYDVGFRDAIFGLQRQDPIYAPLCSAKGTQLDLAAYSQGWQEGYYEYERRKAHGGVD
ncbi:MAG TPA: hypothetical protein VEQ87_04455 [Burkholderiales bacterium]|nr:hypothetical protein [Burkholderiales bacterium]